MADEVEMIPVAGAEPPKKVATLKLNPLARKPGESATAALKPGLKLPPKPSFATGLKLPPKPGAGATAALKPGLKLPPKPGAGATAALKPGLKLPPKPGAGATAALKPGLKLPPKPGLATGLKLPPKPGAGTAAAPKPGLKLPPKPVAVDAQGVGKLPTVEAKTIDRNDVSPVVSTNPNPMEALKSVTQKLKGITQEIPQQAILHKTGIIADGVMSDSQKEAAKNKTARISLSDAMGVAPVKDEAAPMKTIRIKRPIDIPSPTSSLTPPPKPETAAVPTAPVATAAAPTPAPAPAPAAPAAPTPAPAPASDTGATVTQRKTIKIARPGVGAVRPSGKFGIKRPGSQAATVPKTARPAAATPAAPADDAAVADIPDLPATPMAPVPMAAPVSDGPAWVWTLSVIVQLAACGVIGALAWFLYENAKLATFCGGLGWNV